MELQKGLGGSEVAAEIIRAVLATLKQALRGRGSLGDAVLLYGVLGAFSVERAYFAYKA